MILRSGLMRTWSCQHSHRTAQWFHDSVRTLNDVRRYDRIRRSPSMPDTSKQTSAPGLLILTGVRYERTDFSR